MQTQAEVEWLSQKQIFIYNTQNLELWNIAIRHTSGGNYDTAQDWDQDAWC